MDTVPAEDWYTLTHDDPEYGLYVRNRQIAMTNFYSYAGSIGEPRRH